MSDHPKPHELVGLFFQTKPCLVSHVVALRVHPDKYKETLRFVCSSGTISVVSSGVRARVLAALHILSHHKAIPPLLIHYDAIDILKGLNLLDRCRKIRQIEKKIDRIEAENPHLVVEKLSLEKAKDDTRKKHQRVKQSSKKAKGTKRKRRIDEYRMVKRNIETEEACPGTAECQQHHQDSGAVEMIQTASVSGALTRKVRAWAKTCLTQDFLDYVLLAMPLQGWKQLADLVHFSPDDFCAPYFLKTVFSDGSQKEEQEISHGHSLVSRWKCFIKESSKSAATCEDDFFAISGEFPLIYLNYSLFRRSPPSLLKSRAMMEEFAKNAPLDHVVWYFEEFRAASRRCEDIVLDRIKEGEWDAVGKSKMTYGKLVERILTFRRLGVKFANELVPMAAKSLEELKAYWKNGDKDKGGNKVAVLGDASASMRVAIEAATIFAGMVSVCLEGELNFFNHEYLASPHKKPSNVGEVLEVCDKVRAMGGTSLAASLWPYYENGVWMDLFVMVTDEGENTPCNGYNFGDLLAKYRADVNPDAALIVVRVGAGDGSFQQSLKRASIDPHVVQLDERRPDHAKFDALLGQVALLSPGGAPVQESVEELAEGSVGASVQMQTEDFVLI